MTLRLYLMPIAGTGNTVQDGRKPKYSSLFTACTMLDYGPEPYCIVVSDVTNTQHNNVIANADVRAVPENLDSTITAGARTTIINAFDAASIPSAWVVVGMTYRELIRRLSGIFRFVQAVHGKGFRFLMNNLDSTIASLPAGAITALQNVAVRLELSTAGITGATTVRQALTNFGQQFATRPAAFKGLSV